MTEGLVDAVSRALERGGSRRSFLSRLALVGSALAVGPVRYLVRPGTAHARVTCSSCGPGAACCDGWTTFCCTFTGENVCPENTYAGGWWKCTSYSGSRYCEDEGVRYYIDCNLIPGHRCDGGCRCSEDRCKNRRTCCVNFRYGNCDTDIDQVTPVVCRVMTCRNPCRFEAYEACSCSGPVDNRTCRHEAGCLPPEGPGPARPEPPPPDPGLGPVQLPSEILGPLPPSLTEPPPLLPGLPGDQLPSPPT